jgi:hypothetical protein
MSGPQPSQALEGHCASIDDGTLYVLSPSGLQSLPLEQNATWSQGAQGQSVTGPACVTAESQGAMYVVGGTSDDNGYGGLQRYFFGNKTWETLNLPVNTMAGRTDHSAAYLEDSQSILVYAGSQPSAQSDLSSQTFLISTLPPYNVQAFTSEAPPTNLPILTPWNSSHAVMVGGSASNNQVFLFEPSQGWTPLGTNLTDNIDATSRGVIVDGTDGSKVLEVYNVNVSPNTVSQIVLLDANGQTADAGQTVGGSSSSRSRKRKRDLSLSNWPSYDANNAPTATRTDCAAVQGPSGIVAVTGGNTDMPVALFQQNDNSWVDVNKYFNSKDQQPLQPSSTVGTAAGQPSATSSSEPSSTSAAGGSNGNSLTNHQRMLRTLGITLGVLCGIAAVFILILLFFRWRKMKRRDQEGYIDEKTGNRMSFADRGASFMKEAGGSVNNLLAPPGKGRFSNPNGSSNGGSHSSLAIIAGKFGGKPSHMQKGSFESTQAFAKDKSGVVVSPEPMEMMDIGDKKIAVPARKPVGGQTIQPPPPTFTYDTEKELANEDRDRNRSSGWSKYFATSGPTGPNGLSHLPAAYVKTQTTSGLTDASDYSRLSSKPSRIPSSALVPPLDIDFSRTIDGQRLSRVTTGSPVFNHSREDLGRRGSAADIHNTTGAQTGLVVNSANNLDRRSQISGYSLSSTNNKRTTMGSTLSSNFTNEYFPPTSETPFTPVSFKDHILGDSRPPSSGGGRPTSSNYTNSVIEPRVPSRGKGLGGGGFFPGTGVSSKPAAGKSGHHKMSSTAAPTSEWASPTMPKAPAPLNVSKGVSAVADDRDSTITVFPRGVPSAYYSERERAKMMEKGGPAGGRGEQKSMVSDMSWLNLGLGGANKI